MNYDPGSSSTLLCGASAHPTISVPLDIRHPVTLILVGLTAVNCQRTYSQQVFLLLKQPSKSFFEEYISFTAGYSRFGDWLLAYLGMDIKADAPNIGIPASSISVRYRTGDPLFRYQTTRHSGIWQNCVKILALLVAQLGCSVDHLSSIGQGTT